MYMGEDVDFCYAFNGCGRARARFAARASFVLAGAELLVLIALRVNGALAAGMG
jgi:hypothetical protein